MCYLGLDLGKKHDYSAIAVVDRLEMMRGAAWRGPERLVVRYLERVPLGTTYPEVVERVRRLVESEMLRGRSVVVVDATGVGAPVVDLLRAARLGCEITAVTMTGGMKESVSGTGAQAAASVPKQDLMAGLQVLLESGELRIASRLREAGALVKELLDVRVRAAGGRAGRVRMGAEGAGEHDDLVMALALAVWRARRGKQTVGWVAQRLF